MKFCPLFSGSSGNSNYIEFSNGNGVLIDVGKSSKQLENTLSKNDINVENIKAIFITHEHSDHISALKVFSSRHEIKIYASNGTIEALKSKGVITYTRNFQAIEQYKECDLGFVSVFPFITSHDCREGFGYVMRSQDGKSLAICTDTGYISEDIKYSLKSCDTIAIESNHDIEMVTNGPYPYYLKRRILSSVGHLSNTDCSGVLPFLVENGTRNIVLSHLSLQNNSPRLALDTAINTLNRNGMKHESDYSILVAPKINSGNICIDF